MADAWITGPAWFQVAVVVLCGLGGTKATEIVWDAVAARINRKATS